jgi:hypothetical protein
MIRMRPVGGAWVAMPNPSIFRVGVRPVTKAERASDATMFIELIANKRTIDLGWKYLTAALAETLLDMVVDNIIVEIEYPDPKDNALTTKQFYTGDKTQDIFNYLSATIEGWTDVSFNAVEI